MKKEEVIAQYFDWLYEIVCDKRYSKEISYRKLLSYLHNTEFKYVMRKDKSRASDGVNLRYRFELACDCMPIEKYLDKPCSVLEMMIALSIRCEENIMDDPQIGNRTRQWFWGMITNLGFGNMTDDRFDRKVVDIIMEKFLTREYSPNGRGGLFTIRNCSEDMRKVEIWTQMLYYLDTMM